ncbi:MAG: nucleotidyltransferase domain-containing protein [Gammaproteobacteria bacterium]|nr:nucleotidyltransferase domain-containing protein [Gammaproteobacteria bacterium]MCY4341831.1 nucleotidyltransferase domain-containing protein [Gammaproteobacteria bacterium]
MNSARDDVLPDVAEAMDEFVRRLDEKEGLPPIVRVMLYGSHARGDFHEESDIDAAVVFDAGRDSATIRKLAHTLADIEAAMLFSDRLLAPSGMPILQEELANPHEGGFFTNVLREGIEWRLPR